MNLNQTIKYSLSELIDLQIKHVNQLSLSRKYDVQPFDVTLRDGLQGLSSSSLAKYFTTEEKMKLYEFLLCKYNPSNLEIGSCVNNKIFPIFNDIETVFNLCETKTNKKNSYILVPNKDKLIQALEFGATNFSLITSVSNSFQIKNTKMSLKDNFINLNNMINYLKMNCDDNNIFPYRIKLYVSCINQCPFEGKLHTDYIVNELYRLSFLNIDKICLSDTCGTLTKKDFINIVDNIKKLGLDTKKISLHLHINPDKEEEAESIFHAALDYGINEFDVSELRTGGCSITINKNELAPNMSYEQYYTFLISYENKKK